jgi:aldose 1-epimerase
VCVGQALSTDHPQLRLAGGYDHCWRFDASEGEALAADASALDLPAASALTPQDISLHVAARLLDPHSGRVMLVLTSEPAIQCYTGQGLPAMARAHAAFAGLCLETQHPPNAPNWPHAPTTVLRPGQVWRSATLHHFGHVRPQPSSTRA